MKAQQTTKPAAGAQPTSKPPQAPAGATPDAALRDGLPGKTYAEQTALVRPKQGAGAGGLGQNPDAALKHQVTGGTGAKTDPERQRPTDASKLPYVEEQPFTGHGLTSWRSAEILSYWSQLDADSKTTTDQNRCVSHAAMASRIEAGPQATSRYAVQVKQAAVGVLATVRGALKRTMSAAIQAMDGASDRIHFGQGTYSDLDKIADAIKLCLTTDAQGGTRTDVAADIHGMFAEERDEELRDQEPQSRGEVERLCLQMKPGEAWMVLVDTDEAAAGNRPDVSQGDHYVTVGARANTPVSMSSVYLYDPWPRQGSQTVRMTDKDFWVYFGLSDESRGRKFSRWLNRTKPMG